MFSTYANRCDYNMPQACYLLQVFEALIPGYSRKQDCCLCHYEGQISLFDN